MRKITASFLTLVLWAAVGGAASAKAKGDWSAVRNLAGQEIAVRTKDGVTSFGILRSADDSGITILPAGKEGLGPQETPFRRDEVAKVWRARLRFGERNTGKGALIGAGAGLGAAIATAYAYGKSGSSDAPVGVVMFPIYGAGIGAVVGAFSTKGHKKLKLIYSL